MTLFVNRENTLNALRVAFPRTLPVMAGFLLLGAAYGVLMNSVGLGAGWTFLTSFLIYAGSMQYAAISLFTAPFSPIYALTLTLMVNARHVFYGLAMLDKLSAAGKFKPYIIFALCDESFSLLSSADSPQEIDNDLFMFWTAFLCRWYWIIGSLTGALLGHLVRFDTAGLDFVLTAMFVVIFLEQWDMKDTRPSLSIGLVSALFCRLTFGANVFMIPTMILILAVFALFLERLAKKVD